MTSSPPPSPPQPCGSHWRRQDSIENGEEEDNGDDDGQGYMVGLSEEDMANHTIELIAGIMPGAVWCIVDDS